MLELSHQGLNDVTGSCEEREIGGRSITWHLLDQVNDSELFLRDQYLSTVYLDILGSSEINGASLSALQSLFKTISHSIATLKEVDGLFILYKLH